MTASFVVTQVLPIFRARSNPRCASFRRWSGCNFATLAASDSGIRSSLSNRLLALTGQPNYRSTRAYESNRTTYSRGTTQNKHACGWRARPITTGRAGLVGCENRLGRRGSISRDPPRTIGLIIAPCRTRTNLPTLRGSPLRFPALPIPHQVIRRTLDAPTKYLDHPDLLRRVTNQ